MLPYLKKEKKKKKKLLQQIWDIKVTGSEFIMRNMSADSVSFARGGPREARARIYPRVTRFRSASVRTETRVASNSLKIREAAGERAGRAARVSRTHRRAPAYVADSPLVLRKLKIKKSKEK